MKSFDWHYDNAHEWLEVDLNYLMIMGVANRISRFSYYSKEENKAYLEGDMDAGILYKAMGDQWNNDGASHIDRGRHNWNPIRNMKRFPIQ